MTLVAIAAVGPGDPGATPDYRRDIQPLLARKCCACHGALKQEASLRLDTRRLMVKGGESGPAVSPGNAAASRLMERVRADEARMPPAGEGAALTPDEIATLAQWIDDGAEAPDEPTPPAADQHWAFLPVASPGVPEDSEGLRSPIDAFLERARRARRVAAVGPANRETFARRLYLDLVGAPPTIDELQAISGDQSPLWRERLTDRLLADPRYGERWGRHWMDIWRYSDWWGLNQQLRNSQEHIWHWRDWIVESLNRDASYAQMLQLMLAADELHPDDLDRLRATGFLARNFFLFNRDQWMEETVEHFGKGVLGLTFNCAKCHDHKYDPIRQIDYYRLRAFFEPYEVRLDMVPGETDFNRDAIPRVFDARLDAPTRLYLRGDARRPDPSVVIRPGLPDVFDFAADSIRSVALPDSAWRPEMRAWVGQAYLAKADARREQALRAWRRLRSESGEDADANRAGQAPRQTEIDEAAAEYAWADAQWKSISARVALLTASEDLRGARRRRAVLAHRRAELAGAKRDAAAARTRLLGASSKDADKALESFKQANARVGRLERTLDEDIDEQSAVAAMEGARWSATRFEFTGRDDPAPKFASISSGRRSALARWVASRRNPLTARVAVNHIWTRHFGRPLVKTVFDFGRNGARPTHPDLLDWLAARFMERDWSMKDLHRRIVTSEAYRMRSSAPTAVANEEVDPDNRWLWRQTARRLESQAVRDSLLAIGGRLDYQQGGPPVPAARQIQSHRRSLYFFHSNNDRSTFLTVFDDATVTECYRRDESVTPQQALALLNGDLALDAAEHIAARLTERAHGDDAFVGLAFLAILGRSVNDAERAACRDALRRWRIDLGAPRATARERLVWTLINHNDFVTVR